MKFLTVLCLLLFGASFSRAQVEGNPDNWCREGFFTKDSKQFEIAVIAGTPASRVYFYRDQDKGCPDDESCRAKAYVVPGDKVIVNRKRGSFACAWYASAKGSPTVGWLRTSDLKWPRTPIVAGSGGWLGEWKYGENSITLTHNKLAGFLNVSGNAIWKGIGDNVHVGEIDGRYEPRNGVIEYSDGDSEYDCRATLRLVGGYMIVRDNMRCGGMNVTFSGIYVKKR